MHKISRLTALLGGVVIVAAACSTAGGSVAPSAAAPSVAAPSAAAATTAPSAAPSAEASVDPKSLLGLILSSGKIRISTDPNYKPFSFLNVDTGKYEGFDTSTAEETVKRLSAKLGKDIGSTGRPPAGTPSRPAAGAAAGTSRSAR